MAGVGDSGPKTRRIITVASYNIHAWVGMDGRCDPERTIRVIRDLSAEVVGLQEVTILPDPSRALGVSQIQAATGMQAVLGTTMHRKTAQYGNVLLTARPIQRVQRRDISLPGLEPRGVLDVELAVSGRLLRVLVTHLGVRAFERRWQVKQILSILEDHQDVPVVLMGDINEWAPWRPARRHLAARFKPGPAPLTYPSRFPLFPLDRLFVGAPGRLSRVRAYAGGEATMASDHLPLVAELSLSHLPSHKDGNSSRS
jgi:endonuclease/exonuclease/phosphatase family metal-dependent hydrolase